MNAIKIIMVFSVMMCAILISGCQMCQKKESNSCQIKYDQNRTMYEYVSEMPKECKD